MTPKTDSVAVLRERLAEERQHAGKGYPEVERRIAAYEAAIAALSAQGEAFGWAREWDGDESDLNNYLFTRDKGETEDGRQWIALYTAPGDGEA